MPAAEPLPMPRPTARRRDPRAAPAPGAATVVALLASVAIAVAQAAAAAPRVVVSLIPVHGLVAAVMDGVATPTLLLRGSTSPHSFALRPSDLRALTDADLVVWVGETLERPLAKALAAGDARRRVVALLGAPGIRVLPAREAGVLATHEPGGGRAGDVRHEADGHAHGGLDPHVWLDPANAVAIVALARDELAALDPVNATRYAANAGRVVARIRALDDAIERRVAPVRDVPYVVFHDAYQAFERRYGLHPVAAVSVSPERPPGARRVAEIRERIVRGGARCVFREPQFEPRLVATLVDGTGARIGVLDPIGAELAPGPQAWFELMERLAGALVECLSAR